MNSTSQEEEQPILYSYIDRYLLIVSPRQTLLNDQAM